MRLCEISKTDNVLHSIKSSNPSIEPNELCDKFNVFKWGKIVELQFSMHFI